MNRQTVRTSSFLLASAALILAILTVYQSPSIGARPRGGAVTIVQLPPPKTTGSVSIEETLNRRRSVRQFDARPLEFAQIGQLAWAGQGITEPTRGLRTAPSAGELYPAQLYLVCSQGTYLYQPKDHSLVELSGQDQRRELSAAAIGQEWVASSPCSFIIAGSVRKVAVRYGGQARQFMLLEAGHVAQNMLLQAVSLGLGAVPVGAFDAREVSKLLEMPSEFEPLEIISVGRLVVQPAGERGAVTRPRSVVLIVPRENFRDEELFETQRILTMAGVQTTIASSRVGTITGMLGGVAASVTAINDVKVDNFDAVIFIDGPGVVEYISSPVAHEIAKEAIANRKILAAISMAPMVLANAGVLRDVRATGFINVREGMKAAGAAFTGNTVERDGLVITANDSLAAISFAQAILAALQNSAAISVPAVQPAPSER